MRDFVSEPCGAWYDLSLSADGKSGVISMPRAVADAVWATFEKRRPIGRDLDLQLPDFVTSRSGGWGFGEVMRCRSPSTMVEEWVFDFPTDVSERGWGRMTQVCATLKTIFHALENYSLPMPLQPYQLLTIGGLTVLPKDDNGGALGVQISLRLSEWVSLHLRTRKQQIIERMIAVDVGMFPSRAGTYDVRNGGMDMQVRPNGRFVLMVGAAVGMSPDQHGWTGDTGFPLTSYNCGLPHQVVILAGLMAMHQAARGDGY